MIIGEVFLVSPEAATGCCYVGASDGDQSAIYLPSADLGSRVYTFELDSHRDGKYMLGFG